MKLIPTVVTRTVARSVLKTQMHSPTILFVAGAVGVVGTAVMAARATLKLEDTLDEIISDHDKLKVARIEKTDLYSNRDFLEARLGLYVRDAGKIIRLYGPTVLVGATSLACLAGAQRIVIRRNAALTAAYGILDKAFKEYRGRVRQEMDNLGMDGETYDQAFLHGWEDRPDVPQEANDPSLGSKRVSAAAPSEYARIFGKGNPNWVDNPEYNFITLRAAEKMADRKLKADTYLFLNDVYEMLGMEKTSAGQVVGWAIGAGGDDYVDFGLFENNESARRFMNGIESSLVINPNVQGVVYDMIDRSVRNR